MLSGAGIATDAKSWAEMSFASTPLIWRLFCDVRAPVTEKFGVLRPTALLSVRGILTPEASATIWIELPPMAKSRACRNRWRLRSQRSRTALWGVSVTVTSDVGLATLRMALIVTVSLLPASMLV